MHMLFFTLELSCPVLPDRMSKEGLWNDVRFEQTRERVIWLSAVRMSKAGRWHKSPKGTWWLGGTVMRPMWGRQKERARVLQNEIRGREGLDHEAS